MAATQKQYDDAKAIARQKVQQAIKTIEAATPFAASMIDHAIQQHQKEVEAFISDTSKSIVDAVLADADAQAKVAHKA